MSVTPKRRRNREIGELVSVKSRGLVKETLVMWYVWIIRLRVHWHRGQAPAATLTSQFPSSLNSSIHHHAISRSPGFIDDESSHINKVRAIEKGLPTRCDPIPNFARTKTCRISSQSRSWLKSVSRRSSALMRIRHRRGRPAVRPSSVVHSIWVVRLWRKGGKVWVVPIRLPDEQQSVSFSKYNSS